MEVTNVNNGSSNAGSAQSMFNPTGMGRDDFLRLLIEQMKHQDPLNPMEDQDFASQLAEFSSLEELRAVNDNLEQGIQIDMMLTQAINNTMSANFIGKSVKAVGDTVAYSGSGDTTLAFRLVSDADHLKVNIKNEAGKVIRTIDLKNYIAGDQSVEWDGQDGDGQQMAAGSYTFEVEAFGENDAPISVDTFTSGRITGVRYEGGNTMLVVNGVDIPFSQIIEITQGELES
ncbi:MAG: hypothetical protein K9N34_01005 [Candidatus Marinimicrobia bacterium]|nr:hypothetical protein [Candidatus Neomarinimicrobiota bacterium]MCF7841156.1 hypothetical protein [Candidatus Neomarinimicrobiota bacterium]MCF7901943.1 hypothetical protein [Candidatus Neomarinimicrobiota bacterium]